MYTRTRGKEYPVKYFVLELEKPETRECFLKLDAEIWTAFLKQQPGFLSKQIWIDDAAPQTLHMIIAWQSKEEWEQIAQEEWRQTEQFFTREYGFSYRVKNPYAEKLDLYECSSFIKRKQEEV